MEQKYKQIMAKLKEARKNDDLKAYKRWYKKLEKWQMEYIAYQPVK